MGKIYLIGAGPGDPGLLTIKARDIIARADVVVYDYLANRVILNHARADAEIIYVGKKGGDHTLPQLDINKLLVEKGRADKIVARLKGGDPYIFGRGGEEAEELVEAGIEFEVVPGVTSAQAATAYAGIPLTHRSHTSSVAYITGHEDPTKDETSIDWSKISTGIGTLVFFMGMRNLPRIVSRLVENGRPATTPVALISWGSHPKQKTLTGTLEDIVPKSNEARFKPPVIIVVGEVVSLRSKLNWFENRPLFGTKIIVTRAREQQSGFADILAELGAEVIQFPTIKISPPASFTALDNAIKNMAGYNWIMFTSVNGVDYFRKRLEIAGLDARSLHGLKVCCIGPATAARIEEMGIKPDLLPEEYRAEGVIEKMEQLSNGNLDGVKILIPRAKVAREILPAKLREMGAKVDIVTAYETCLPDTGTKEVAQLLRDGTVDIVTFTSSSTVSNFCKMFPDGSWKELVANSKIACIGPITADTARDTGMKVDIMPSDYTITALARELVDYRHSCDNL